MEKQFSFLKTRMLLSAAFCLCVVSFGSILFGCTTEAADLNNSAVSSSTTSAGSRILPHEANPSDFGYVKKASSLRADYDVIDYVEHSDLIVVGVVESASNALLIKPDEMPLESSMYFTDYRIKPTEVLFESENVPPSSVDDEIDIRTEGGVGQRVLMVAEDDPQLEIGSQYLFFLQRDYAENRYKTDGDYFLIIGAFNGVWDASGSGEYESRSKEEAASPTELAEMIAQYGGSMAGEAAKNHQEFLDEIKQREEAGELAQGSYQQYVDEEEKVKSSNATILSESEQAAFEEALLRGQSGDGIIAASS